MIYQIERQRQGQLAHTAVRLLWGLLRLDMAISKRQMMAQAVLLGWLAASVIHSEQNGHHLDFEIQALWLGLGFSVHLYPYLP